MTPSSSPCCFHGTQPGADGPDSALSAAARKGRVDDLLEALGLRDQADTLIGTPLRRGLSGGQKRRVGVASQLITGPRVLFLDEPTSGLDAHAGREVVAHLRRVARRHRLVVVASIHQPSAAAFALFDRLLLLARGRPCYFGPVAAVADYCAARGRPVPPLTNAAEFLLDTVASDFAPDRAAAVEALAELQAAWAGSAEAEALRADIQTEVDGTKKQKGAVLALVDGAGTGRAPGFGRVVLALLHRSFLKSYRDVVAYGVRVAMYLGLALMMGTIWLRLDTDQSSIQPVINGLVRGSCPLILRAGSSDPLPVLRLGLHVLHGRRLCARLHRRPSAVRQGTPQRPVRCHGAHAVQLSRRRAVSLYVSPFFSLYLEPRPPR